MANPKIVGIYGRSCPQMWQYRFWHIAIWKYDEVWVPKRLKHVRCNPDVCPWWNRRLNRFGGRSTWSTEMRRDASNEPWVGQQNLENWEGSIGWSGAWATHPKLLDHTIIINHLPIVMGIGISGDNGKLNYMSKPLLWPQVLATALCPKMASRCNSQIQSVMISLIPRLRRMRRPPTTAALGCHAAPIASARDLEVAAWERLSFNFFNSSASQGQGSLSRAPWVPSLDILQQKDESWSHKPWISAQASTGLTWELLNGVRNHQCVGAFGGDVGRTNTPPPLPFPGHPFVSPSSSSPFRNSPLPNSGSRSLRAPRSGIGCKSKRRRRSSALQELPLPFVVSGWDPFHFPWVLKWHRGSPPLWPRSIPGSGVWIPRYRPRYPIDCQHT